MNENEKAKTLRVLYLGKKLDCTSNDIIQVNLSPDWLEEIAGVFKQRAMHDIDYIDQGFNRQKADFFDMAYREWQRARNELDNEDMKQIQERN